MCWRIQGKPTGVLSQGRMKECEVRLRQWGARRQSTLGLRVWNWCRILNSLLTICIYCIRYIIMLATQLSRTDKIYGAKNKKNCDGHTIFCNCRELYMTTSPYKQSDILPVTTFRGNQTLLGSSTPFYCLQVIYTYRVPVRKKKGQAPIYAFSARQLCNCANNISGRFITGSQLGYIHFQYLLKSLLFPSDYYTIQ